MKKNELNPIGSVLQLIQSHFGQKKLQTEWVSLEESFGRVLSCDIVSEEMIPPFPKSTVDGYAVRFSEVPSQLKLIETVSIGHIGCLRVEEGTCIYVPTGGAVPPGTDTVVMVEQTCKISSELVQINKPSVIKDNIIDCGGDMQIGTLVLKQGRRISEHEIGALASLGIYDVPVYKKPLVSILSAGDELVAGKEIKEGQIRDVNTYTIAALCRKMGLEIHSRQLLKDDYNDLVKALQLALQESDLVILSGGSSVGERDYTFDLINQTSRDGVILNGMAIKPGKPTLIGKDGQKPIIGLPGHPVSAIVVFKIIVTQLLQAWGYPPQEDRFLEVVLTRDIYSAEERDTYQMVTIYQDAGQWFASPTSGKSGMISLLTNSNGYIIIPHIQQKWCAGERVKAYFFN